MKSPGRGDRTQKSADILDPFFDGIFQVKAWGIATAIVLVLLVVGLGNTTAGIGNVTTPPTDAATNRDK